MTYNYIFIILISRTWYYEIGQKTSSNGRLGVRIGSRFNIHMTGLFRGLVPSPPSEALEQYHHLEFRNKTCSQVYRKKANVGHDSNKILSLSPHRELESDLKSNVMAKDHLFGGEA